MTMFRTEKITAKAHPDDLPEVEHLLGYVPRIATREVAMIHFMSVHLHNGAYPVSAAALAGKAVLEMEKWLDRNPPK